LLVRPRLVQLVVLWQLVVDAADQCLFGHDWFPLG
jgi:hypothetical protein